MLLGFDWSRLRIAGRLLVEVTFCGVLIGRAYVLQGFDWPSVFSYHGLLGGFGGLCAYLLIGLAHRHQRHCVSFDWSSFRVAGL